MDLDYYRKQLADNAQRIRALVEGVTDQQARWRPAADAWSILEVLCHLLEEEQKDFPVRLDYTLNRPGESWPAIDPAGWVVEHAYNEQNVDESLQAFLQERRASLVWLETLEAAPWQTTYAAPWGAIAAGDLLISWAAHDLLHMRQLVELLWAYAYNEQQAGSYSMRYAGEW